jgi:excisionase family DNA binding protein
MNQNLEPLAVTRQQAAQMLNISVTEIDDERRSGRLQARRHGRKVLIPVAELRRWVEALPSDEMRFASAPNLALVTGS